MQPEQKRISATLRPGTFWDWRAKDAPIKFHYSVVGPGAVDVPAGHYQGIHLTTAGTVQAPFGKVDIRQETWFVPGVGIAKQETDTSVQRHKLSGVLLTLEKLKNRIAILPRIESIRLPRFANPVDLQNIDTG